MKLDLDFKKLETEWQERQLDLFPWLDGLFALLRTRGAILKETEKKLSASTPATMAQFLSSDDRDNAHIARTVIKTKSPDSILPIILFSLEKIKKQNYPNRVMESLLDFDNLLSSGYLLGYLNIRPAQSEQIFRVLDEIFLHFNELFPPPQGGEHFLITIFQSIRDDLKERMSGSQRIKFLEDMAIIEPDLKVMAHIFKKTSHWDIVKIVEKEMQRIGKEVIISLSGIPFELKKGEERVIEKLKTEIIPFIAMMRLEADRPFLETVLSKIEVILLAETDKEEIRQKAEAAIQIINQPQMTIVEIVNEMGIPFFFNQ